MTKSVFCILLLSFIFLSCKKENADVEAVCQNIQNVTIASNSPVTIGQKFKFGTQEVGGYRVYKWQGPNNYSGQNPSDSITNVQLQNEGWYYLTLTSSYSSSNCRKIDSVYLDVKLLQGTPPCLVSTNTATYNNLPNDTYASISKYINSTFSQKVLAANSTALSSLTIYFHTHWRTAEPEDGIYTTIDSPVFDQADNNYNKVFITATKSSIYWSSAANQTVYISHVGSKLQVRYCNLSMGGSFGASYTTITSGNVVEQ